MRRREFMILSGAAAVAWPLAGGAQPPTHVSRVGILSDETRSVAAEFFEPPFVQALQALGYTEGLNIAFERRYAERKYAILPSLAAELVSLRPDVILAIGTPAARAAKAATQTTPIVFARIGDPVGMGLVPALARPGETSPG
jgi:putative ABC transport system substrate-binding protein